MNPQIPRPGTHRRDNAGTTWERLMAHKVEDGVELTFEQIGEIASVSKQFIEQIYSAAVRKLRRRASVVKLYRDMST